MLKKNNIFYTWKQNLAYSFGNNTRQASDGDHIVVRRSHYTHHAIYIQGKAIHYTKINGEIKIQETDLRTFLSGSSEYGVVPSKTSYSPDILVVRARSRLNERAYDLANNNCMHFALWVHYGPRVSRSTPYTCD